MRSCLKLFRPTPEVSKALPKSWLFGIAICFCIHICFSSSKCALNVPLFPHVTWKNSREGILLLFLALRSGTSSSPRNLEYLSLFKISRNISGKECNWSNWITLLYTWSCKLYLNYKKIKDFHHNLTVHVQPTHWVPWDWSPSSHCQLPWKNALWSHGPTRERPRSIPCLGKRMLFPQQRLTSAKPNHLVQFPMPNSSLHLFA